VPNEKYICELLSCVAQFSNVFFAQDENWATLKSANPYHYRIMPPRFTPSGSLKSKCDREVGKMDLYLW
jgi:hypothetical protein